MITTETSILLLWISLLAPFVGAALCPLAFHRSPRQAVIVPLLSALLPALALSWLAGPLQQTIPVNIRWMDELPLEFSFLIDGFGALFALLVSWMGVFIVWYAHGYMKDEPGQGRFFSFLLVFLGAMLGMALSDHFFTTFLFWELTSVSSFLLIGFWHEKEKSRDGALKALFITSIGGLFLMAGLALLGAKSGLWRWSELGALPSTVADNPWFTVSFVLILIGVFTKSAQFPFHIWLPDAMEAPTPVSAFLHSATMVKAGVFLLFRLYPVFSQSFLWVPLLLIVGMTTVVVGSTLALKHKDLKAILAYTTISQLGLFVALHGYSGLNESMSGAIRTTLMFHLFSHAFYKGALFMLTGIVDHAMHTRDTDRLGLLSKPMPRVMICFVVASASMAGLPPFLGFISKEMILGNFVEGFHSFSWGLIPLSALIFSAVLTVAIALKLSVALGWQAPVNPNTSEQTHPHDPPWTLLAPPAILCVAGVLFGLAPNALAAVLYPRGWVGQSVVVEPSFSLWHGINIPLMISLAAVAGGTVVYRFRLIIQRWQDSFKPRWNLNHIYNSFWTISLGLAQRSTHLIQNGSLTRYNAVLLACLTTLGLATILSRPGLYDLSLSWSDINWIETLCVGGLIITSWLVVLMKDLLTRVLCLGSAGILMCAFFTLRGAPDLALTGFLVEIVMFIVILLVLKQLKPEQIPSLSWRAVLPRALLATMGGLMMGAFVFVVLEKPLSPSIHPYFFSTSQNLAGGLNVVNVILVDFRGFDTMGEVLVLCLAGLSVFGLRKIWVGRPTPAECPPELAMTSLGTSPLLMAVSSLCFPLIFVFSLYLTLKGHNEPGGGFIGGLVCASGLVLEMLAVGRRRFLKQFPVNGQLVFAIGLIVSFTTGLIPLFFGFPFLTSAVFHELHFSTAAIFDVGVYLIVIGVTLDMITLLEEGERKETES